MKPSIRKVFLVLAAIAILTVPLAQGIEKVGGEEDENALLATDSYVLDFPISKQRPLLDKAIKLNNKYEFNLIPTVTVGGKQQALSPDNQERGIFNNPQGSYSFSFRTEFTESTTDQYITINEGTVVLETKVTNKGKVKQTGNVFYSFRGGNDTAVFLPSAVDEGVTSYAVMTDSDNLGLGLGIISSHPIKGTEEFSSKKTQSVMASEELEPDQTLTVKMILVPLNLQLSEGSQEFPSEYLGHMENPLIKSRGSITPDLISKDTPSKTQEIMNDITKKKEIANGEFKTIRDVNISKSSYDSLEASMAFKEKCKKEKIPCRLVIGEEATWKYAWVQSWEEGKWTDIDIVKGEKKIPGKYEVIYTEPLPRYVEIRGSKVDSKNYLEATRFLDNWGGGQPFLLWIAIISGIVIGVTLVYWKATQMIAESDEGEAVTKDVPVDGKYIIKSSEEDLDDPSAFPVFEKVVEEGGDVNVQRYSEELSYSEEFVKDSIRYLEEEGHIQLEESAAREEFLKMQRQKEDEEEKEKKEHGLMSKIPFELPHVVSILSEKTGLEHKKLLALIGILGAGLITILLILLLL